MPNLSQYPSPSGARNQVVATIPGPASYTQVGVASPPTGGITVLASQFGMVAFEFAVGGVSDDGQYIAIPIFPNNPAKECPSIILMVVVAATGAQAAGTTNLSARTFRFFAFGY